jgi:hypothetical protein
MALFKTYILVGFTVGLSNNESKSIGFASMNPFHPFDAGFVTEIFHNGLALPEEWGTLVSLTFEIYE